jgi:hypothetical protein
MLPASARQCSPLQATAAHPSLLRATSALLRLSAALRVIEQSVAALAWLCQSEEGWRAFPSLASPGSMP